MLFIEFINFIRISEVDMKYDVWLVFVTSNRSIDVDHDFKTA